MTSAQLATRPQTELTRGSFWNEERVTTLRRTLAKDTNDAQFAVFMEAVKATGLNPFAREIYAIVRQGVMTIQFGIDGLRRIAGRTGLYRGQDGPYYCGQDGVWRDVWLSDETPKACKIGVYVAGFPQPVFAVVHYTEFVRIGGPLWKSIPLHMMAVRAETHAIKKAFSQDLHLAAETLEARGISVSVEPAEHSLARAALVSARQSGVALPPPAESAAQVAAVREPVPARRPTAPAAADRVLEVEDEAPIEVLEEPTLDALAEQEAEFRAGPPPEEWAEPAPAPARQAAQRPAVAPGNGPTEKQLNYIRRLHGEQGIDTDEEALAQMTRLDATKYIERLMGKG